MLEASHWTIVQVMYQSTSIKILAFLSKQDMPLCRRKHLGNFSNGYQVQILFSGKTETEHCIFSDLRLALGMYMFIKRYPIRSLFELYLT